MTDSWKDWWRKRGDDRLTLLLWAVWNPIGPVPLDEYENYAGQVVRVLHDAHKADLELLPAGAEPDDSVQRQRNALHAASVVKLATLLSSLRDRMGMPPSDDADHRAAETLLDWYDWEMEPLG